MLIRITNRCDMGCRHCMVDSVPDGDHMGEETFDAALEFAQRCERGIPSPIVLSGGEPTQHPDILRYIHMVLALPGVLPRQCVLISNGVFLEDWSLREEILASGVTIQITRDRRFYPRAVPEVEHPRITYVDQLLGITSFGRARKNGIEATRCSPECYNLRALAQRYGFGYEALRRLRAFGKYCTPTIDADGTVRAGEASECLAIGTVRSTSRELTAGIHKQCWCPTVDLIPSSYPKLGLGRFDAG